MGDHCSLTGKVVMGIFQELNSISNKLDTLNVVKTSHEMTRNEVSRPSKSHLQLSNSSSTLRKMPTLSTSQEGDMSKGKNMGPTLQTIQVALYMFSNYMNHNCCVYKGIIYSLSQVLWIESNLIDFVKFEGLPVPGNFWGFLLLLIFTLSRMSLMLLTIERYVAFFAIFIWRVFADQKVLPLLLRSICSIPIFGFSPIFECKEQIDFSSRVLT